MSCRIKKPEELFLPLVIKIFRQFLAGCAKVLRQGSPRARIRAGEEPAREILTTKLDQERQWLSWKMRQTGKRDTTIFDKNSFPWAQSALFMEN